MKKGISMFIGIRQRILSEIGKKSYLDKNKVKTDLDEILNELNDTKNKLYKATEIIKELHDLAYGGLAPDKEVAKDLILTLEKIK